MHGLDHSIALRAKNECSNCTDVANEDFPHQGESVAQFSPPFRFNNVVLPFTFSPPIKAVDGRKIGIRMTVNIFLGVLCYRLLLSKLSLLLPSSGSSWITLNLWSFHCCPRRLMLPWPSSPLVNPTPSSFSFSSSSLALTL